MKLSKFVRTNKFWLANLVLFVFLLSLSLCGFWREGKYYWFLFGVYCVFMVGKNIYVKIRNDFFDSNANDSK